MIQESKILALLMGAGVLHFIVLKRAELKENPSIGLMIPSFCLLLLAWVFDIMEGFFGQAVLNLLEHLAYLASAACLFVWTLRISLNDEGTHR